LEKIEKNQRKCKQQKTLMNKNLKVNLIIPTLNTKTIATSNLFENFKDQSLKSL
jgi:hypothetical protein